MKTYYVSPNGAGNAHGHDYENAIPFERISRLMGRVRDSDNIILIADQGPYLIDTSVNLYSSGKDGSPITISGSSRSGHPQNALFVGDRSPIFSVDNPPGTEVFRLNTGTAFLEFQNLAFENISNAFSITGKVHDITFENMEARNVSRFLENTACCNQTEASAENLVIRGIKVSGFSKGVIRLRYDTQNVMIDNVHGDSLQTDGANFAMGIHLGGTVHDVVIQNSSMGNIKDSVGGRYWNGDGFATERDAYNIIIENSCSYNNTDSGFDIKSRNTKLENVTAESNTRNFRFWSDITVTNLTGTNPRYHGGSSRFPANVWLGENVTVTIRNSDFLDDDDYGYLFDLREAGSQLTIEHVRTNQVDSGIDGDPRAIAIGSQSVIIGMTTPIVTRQSGSQNSTPSNLSNGVDDEW